jgi:glycosyltransferase involved in cell wall biosynthesis
MGVSAAPPRVSVIVPARNEGPHIDACVRSILGQRVHGEIEVIVADGRSSDGTAAIASAAGATVVDNPTGRTPHGLNAALAAARGDVVVRFDAHATMPPGYVEACLRALAEEPGAVNVGGWRRVDAIGPWGRATGAALASRFGVGNPRIWRRPEAGSARVDVDTVPLGCWPASRLRAVGGWSESFLRNQDFELNHRLRSAGGRVVFDPDVWSIYRPRESLRGIASQYWQYGWFKALMLATAPESLRPRQLAPVGLLAAAALSALPIRPARAARAALVAYAVGLAAASAHSRAGWRTAVVFSTVHVAWAGGLTGGLAKVALARLAPGQSANGVSSAP